MGLGSSRGVGWAFVGAGLVKLNLIIHTEAVTSLPKLANETPSCQGARTGHSDQLLNENDQVSYVALGTAQHQRSSSDKTHCCLSFSSGSEKCATAAVFRAIKTPKRWASLEKSMITY